MFAGLGVGDTMAITSLRALLFTVGGVVAVGGAAYIAGAFDKPSAPPASTQVPAPAAAIPEPGDAKTAPGTQERVAAADPKDTGAEAKPATAERAPAAPEPAAQADGGVVAPTFDVVRVEGDGSLVIAGKAAANARVEIIHGSNVLGEATAGADGTFVVVLDDPLKPGDYQLVLRSTQPDGVVATSQQTAVVSVPEKADGQVLAMVEEPGKAAELLTVPVPEKKAEAPAAASEPAPGKAPAADAAAPEPAVSPTQEPAQPQAEAAAPPVSEQPAVPEQPATPEQPAVTAAAPKVVVEAVEIDGSKIFVAGLADAGRKVRAYANDILLGDALASPDGHFLVEATRDIPVGQYTVRVDVLEADGKVAARATVPFDREPGEAISAVAPQTAPEAATQPAAAEAAQAPAADVPETAAPKLEHADGAVIIRRGDSLWRISRRVYGHGIRYSTIYLANQKQIADPDKIWPGQVFTVPEKSREGEAADLKALGDQATTVPAQ